MIPPLPRSWLGVLVSPRGTLSSGVSVRMIFFACVALVVWGLNRAGYHRIRLPVGLHEVAGAVIALILAFRTNTAYNRFWEGRTLWGGVVNACRNLQRGLRHHAGLSDEENREASVWIVIFAHSMRRLLRSEQERPEITRLLSADDDKQLGQAPHQPLFAAARLSDLIVRLGQQGRLNPMMQRHNEALLATLVDYLGGCERIAKTPTPAGYVLLLERCIAFYIAAMPFALIEELGWLTIPVTMMVAYLVLMIEALGRELDDPFGHEPNDLPLSRICITIEQNLLSSSPEPILLPKTLLFED